MKCEIKKVDEQKNVWEKRTHFVGFEKIFAGNLKISWLIQSSPRIVTPKSKQSKKHFTIFF